MKLSLTLFALSVAIETRTISATNTTRNLYKTSKSSKSGKSSKALKGGKGGKGSSKAPKGGKGGKGSSKAPKDVYSSKNPKSSKAGKGGKGGKGGHNPGGSTGTKLPEVGSVIDGAFPMWEIDEGGNRVNVKECTPSSCEWNPFYVTKRYDGLHPDFGGHPTDFDVKYAFFFASPFGGQPYSGTPHHCSRDASDDIKAKDCPKIETTTDKGMSGPGHIPPHIALASLTWGVENGLFSMEEIFDYDIHHCRVIPHVLLDMIRYYFPRVEGEKVAYPPPITPEGGDFQYEFPSGNGLDKQEPPYAPGPPHWCTAEMTASGHWDGVCPYVFEGPDAGKYRHPHIAYAALEVYLANIAMPDKCAKTWLQNNPDFLDPDRVTTDTPFPVMSNDSYARDTVQNWLGQPVLPWDYTSYGPKAVEGVFATQLYFS